MSSRAFNPEFVISWPKSEVAIMGKEQAYDVMSSLSAKTEKIEENYDTYKSSSYMSSILSTDAGSSVKRQGIF